MIVVWFYTVWVLQILKGENPMIFNTTSRGIDKNIAVQNNLPGNDWMN